MDKGNPPKSDHDLLIELNTKFEIFMVQNKNDMVQLRDGYREKINDNTNSIKDHETRLNSIEALRDQIDPMKMSHDLKTLQGSVHDFTLSIKLWRVMGGMVGGAILWILTQLPNILNFFDKLIDKGH